MACLRGLLLLYFGATVSASCSTPCAIEFSPYLGRAWCANPCSANSSAAQSGTAAADASAAARAAPLKDLLSLFTNVNGSIDHVYDLKDSTGHQMASLHVMPNSTKAGLYVGLYMSMINSSWQVRVATSEDLMEWKFVRTLLLNADMPYVKQVPGNEWLVVVHEQWMGINSTAPSQLGFKLYRSLEHLLKGVHFDSFVAPLTVGLHSSLEGTPNIYNISAISNNDGTTSVSLEIGFHYNNEAGIDQVAQGTLDGFGASNVQSTWKASAATAYNHVFISKGAVGNIGQRDSGTIGPNRLIIQEANTGHMPPTVWQDWRLWLYVPAATEQFPPTGEGSPYMISPVTDKGSYAFGNPSFQTVPCPFDYPPGSSTCLFVSFFAFGEGAAPGEAGVVAFYNRYEVV